MYQAGFPTFLVTFEKIEQILFIPTRKCLCQTISRPTFQNRLNNIFGEKSFISLTYLGVNERTDFA